MPTLLIQDGFKFFFYANEHEPKHIHVSKACGFAKIDLETLRPIRNFLRQKELKRALQIVDEHRGEFKRRWNEYFRR